MDRAVANASQSWFLALKPPVLLDPLARRIACPDLAEPTITPYMTAGSGRLALMSDKFEQTFV